MIKALFWWTNITRRGLYLALLCDEVYSGSGVVLLTRGILRKSNNEDHCTGL